MEKRRRLDMINKFEEIKILLPELVMMTSCGLFQFKINDLYSGLYSEDKEGYNAGIGFLYGIEFMFKIKSGETKIIQL